MANYRGRLMYFFTNLIHNIFFCRIFEESDKTINEAIESEVNTAFSVEDKDFIPSESETYDELDCGNKALKQWSKKSILILRALGKVTLFYEY